MIYLTGDTHGGLDMDKLRKPQLDSSNISLTENDIVIITGDFGFPFLPSDITDLENNSGDYAYWIGFLREFPCRILFIDGNHDNHDWWAKQEVSEMFGGRVQVHPHATNVIHLMRGEVYTIEGKTFFTFGGALSIDKEHRTEGITWWRGEEPSDEEMEHALANLKKHDLKVDYIITHTMPNSIIAQLPMFRHKLDDCRAAVFLDEILEKVKYDKWYCGHFHIDLPIFRHNIFILYNKLLPINFF